VAHEVLEGYHSILYRKVAVWLEQSFISLTVTQEQEHALGQFVRVCNTTKSEITALFSLLPCELPLTSLLTIKFFHPKEVNQFAKRL
jgi:hypothetical protein